MAEHGTTSRYTYGCRCTDCRSAKYFYDKARHAAARELAAANPRYIPHGTTTGYQHWGCRCEQCRAAARAAKQRWPSATRKRARRPARE